MITIEECFLQLGMYIDAPSDFVESSWASAIATSGCCSRGPGARQESERRNPPPL